MNGAKVTLDASPTSVVAVCSACPSWRVLRGTRAAAHLAAAAHLELAHDGWKQAAKARELAARQNPPTRR